MATKKNYLLDTSVCLTDADSIYKFDNHDIFQRQWSKRRAYYAKHHYKIIHSNNHDYYSDKWETIFDPKKQVKCKQTKTEKENNLIKGLCYIKL